MDLKGFFGQQCIGPCYEKGSQITHPLYFNIVGSSTHDFCPTNKWNHNGEDKIIDYCNKSRSDNNDNSIYFEIPIFKFNYEMFLKIIYKFNSLNDIYNYINDDNINLNTTNQ